MKNTAENELTLDLLLSRAHTPNRVLSHECELWELVKIMVFLK